MLTPKLQNSSLQYVSKSNSEKKETVPKTSWVKILTTTALSLTGLTLLTQWIYNSNYSPSSSTHSLNSIAPTWNFSTSETLPESTTFKAAQIFYNIFETKSSLFHALGLNPSEPFGDLQAFALDGDLNSLEQAYNSYPENQVTYLMKDKLLGQVLRHMNQNHKDLTHILKWLLKIGANVNYQENKTRLEQKDLSKNFNTVLESTYTTLGTAFKKLDVNLYEDLVSNGANPGMQIPTYLLMDGQRFDDTPTIIEYIIDQCKNSLQNDQTFELDQAYLCPIYKRIIDTSFLDYQTNKNLNNLRIQTYIEKIKPYFCKDHFTVNEDEQLNYEADKLAERLKEPFKEYKNQQPAPKTSFNEQPDTDDLFKTAMDLTERFAFNNAAEFLSDITNSANQIAKDAANMASKLADQVQNSKILESAGNGVTDAAVSVGNLATSTVNSATELAVQIINSKTLALILEAAGNLALSTANSAAELAAQVKDSKALASAGKFATEAVISAGNLAASTAKSAAELTVQIQNSETLALAVESTGNLAASAAKSAVELAVKIKDSEILASAEKLATSAASAAGQLALDTANKAAELAAQVKDSKTLALVGNGVTDAVVSAGNLAASAASSAAELAAQVKDSKTLALVGNGITDAVISAGNLAASAASSAAVVVGDLKESAVDGLVSAKETVKGLTAGSSENKGLQAKK